MFKGRSFVQSDAFHELLNCIGLLCRDALVLLGSRPIVLQLAVLAHNHITVTVLHRFAVYESINFDVNILNCLCDVELIFNRILQYLRLLPLSGLLSSYLCTGLLIMKSAILSASHLKHHASDLVVESPMLTLVSLLSCLSTPVSV